ncbi:hypothetical protein EUX98_g9058 [Antrodiella citrinella]|uniref:F-box domain-containing protein n=1 Tax=Antrodiella citrinella TaxID=2447956 RepID=A0A4S4LYM3_9APHY|nr:hypothetical protein EUX98_g9058 [Antrodiella citrinella]
MPTLRELSIEFDACDSEPVQPAIPLLSSQYPLTCLKTVSVCGVSFWRISPFLRPTLASLSLQHYWSTPEDGPNLADLFSALSAMPLLEDLVISQCFYPDDTDGDLPVVELQTLQRFCLETNTDACADILSHLILPLSSLTVGGVCGVFEEYEVDEDEDEDEDEEDNFSSFAELSRAVLPILGGNSVTGVLPTVDSLKVVVVDDDDDTGDSAKISVEAWEDTTNVLAYSYTDATLPLGDALDVIYESAPNHFMAGIRTLYIIAAKPRPWRRMDKSHSNHLSSLSNLVALHISRAHGFIKDIVGQHIQASLDCKFDLPNYITSTVQLPPVVVPLPNLRVLSLDGITIGAYDVEDEDNSDYDYEDDRCRVPYTDLLPAIRLMLAMRQAKGIQLSLLEIRNAHMFQSTDAEQLRDVVGRLEWDGRVTMRPPVTSD